MAEAKHANNLKTLRVVITPRVEGSSPSQGAELTCLSGGLEGAEVVLHDHLHADEDDDDLRLSELHEGLRELLNGIFDGEETEEDFAGLIAGAEESGLDSRRVKNVVLGFTTDFTNRVENAIGGASEAVIKELTDYVDGCPPLESALRDIMTRVSALEEDERTSNPTEDALRENLPSTTNYEAYISAMKEAERAGLEPAAISALAGNEIHLVRLFRSISDVFILINAAEALLFLRLDSEGAFVLSSEVRTKTLPAVLTTVLGNGNFLEKCNPSFNEKALSEQVGALRNLAERFNENTELQNAITTAEATYRTSQNDAELEIDLSLEESKKRFIDAENIDGFVLAIGYASENIGETETQNRFNLEEAVSATVMNKINTWFSEINHIPTFVEACEKLAPVQNKFNFIQSVVKQAKQNTFKRLTAEPKGEFATLVENLKLLKGVAATEGALLILLGAYAYKALIGLDVTDKETLEPIYALGLPHPSGQSLKALLQARIQAEAARLDEPEQNGGGSFGLPQDDNLGFDYEPQGPDCKVTQDYSNLVGGTLMPLTGEDLKQASAAIKAQDKAKLETPSTTGTTTRRGGDRRGGDRRGRWSRRR